MSLLRNARRVSSDRSGSRARWLDGSFAWPTLVLLAGLAFVSLSACDANSDVIRPTPEPDVIDHPTDGGTPTPELEPEGSPCRPIRCGDGIVDPPETCDTQDPETQQGCNEDCRQEPPAGWTCYSNFFGDGDCDCGCGIADLDCPDAQVASCTYTHCPPQHVPLPGNTGRCTLVATPGDTCESPVLLTGLSGSVSGILDTNDDFDGFAYDVCTIDPSVGEGGDVVYQLRVPDETVLGVQMVTDQFSPTVFVLDTCGYDPASCVGAGENFLQRTVAELELANFSGEARDFFIVADSYVGQGNYTLSWQDIGFPACGDGTRDPYDECDDGNLEPGDGCDDLCLKEPGFACPLEGGACVTSGCGNGILEPNEVCDDGNLNNGDGCNADCAREPPATWTCPLFFFGSSDGCDCGCGAFDTDCPSLERDVCQYENCSTGVEQDQTLNYTCRTPACGDSIVEGVEECDDGNDDAGDGCFQCRREAPPDWTCPARWYGAGDGCHCGCGVVDADCASATAECDVNGCLAGGPNADDNTLCIVYPCGDGDIDPGEACDDGNTLAGDGCSANCQYIEAGFVCPSSEGDR